MQEDKLSSDALTKAIENAKTEAEVNKLQDENPNFAKTQAGIMTFVSARKRFGAK